MSFQVNVAHVLQFKANVEHLLQQMDSRLTKAITVSHDYKGKGVKFIEQIGAVAATERTTRHADVVPVSVPHAGRWFYPRDYDLTEFVDAQDKLRMLYDPTSYYAQSFKYAHNRKIDEVILDSFFGTAFAGENGTDQLLWTNFQATQRIAAGGLGLTVDKLIQAREILRAAENDDNDPMYMAITANEETDLFHEIQVVNTQYNDRPVMANGKISSFMGFNFIHTELIRSVAAEHRCPAWVKSGMHLGFLKDVETDVGPRRDKGATTQVYTCASYGASRTQELKIVEVMCA
jgi:hypothetical protein